MSRSRHRQFAAGLLSLALLAFVWWFSRPDPSAPVLNSLPPLAPDTEQSPAPTRALGSEQSPEFGVWLDRYLARTSGVDQVQWENEGIKLATRRRAEMRALIEIDPARALENRLPLAVRERLPRAIEELLEEPINGVGELAVYCQMHENGGGETFRVARIGGRQFDAYVYGRRLDDSSRPSAFLDGVAVDGKMAVSDRPLRVIEGWTGPSRAGVCAWDGHELSEGIGVMAGGLEHAVCGEEHLVLFEEALWQSEAAGAGGGGVSRTEGAKRAILMRVDFSDLEGEPFTQERGRALVAELNEFFEHVSYGRASLDLAGEGSEVTPVLRMPNTAAYYGQHDRYNELRLHARAAADQAGYVLSEYDFDVTCLGRVPGFNWGGLGYVGGVGAWIRNTSASSIAAHELGHNLGLNHANYWDTGGESVASQGRSVEYGDIYDTMGSAGTARKHFHARYRELLKWIRPDEFVSVTNSGVYRIFAVEDLSTVVPRALRIGKDNIRNYWVEFRQDISSNPWLMNGATLRFGGNANQRSDLLDTTPGSPEGRTDAPLVIGRTYSDRQAGVHITPVGFGQTSPESLDLVVQLGGFPGNRPPTVSVIPSKLAVAPGQWLHLQAIASDADGDPLAYDWDLGGGVFGTNGPAAAHRWFSHGEQIVRCVVSDMKGGRASGSVLISVGTPTRYRISGRVAAAGQPLEGVRVQVSASQVAYTDSDGDYHLANLQAGSYVVTATVGLESVGGHVAAPVGFVNPVTVGPSAGNIDFLVSNPTDALVVELIASGSVWRYRSSRTNLSSLWVALGYDDTDWLQGPSELGYGDGDEATLLDYGPNPADKPVTTYFRQEFVVEDRGDYSEMEVALLRDDGAVVYLNGVEVVRSNMPGGVIGPGTLAASTVGGADERVFHWSSVSPALLNPGRNIMAAEVHQANPSSSDLSFDLRLRGLIASSDLVTSGSVWRYYSGESVQEGWSQPSFQDAAWLAGPAQLGYGDGDEATVLDFGPDSNRKWMTAYFRHQFVLLPGTRVGTLRLGLLRDDGAAVYLNGVEVFRSNLPQTPLEPTTPALVAVTGSDENRYLEVPIDPAGVAPGPNLLAVRLHQVSPSSSDLSFDLYLKRTAVRETRGVVRLVSPVHLSRASLGVDVELRAEVFPRYGEDIQAVAFYDAGRFLGETRQAPYRLAWSQPSPGMHTIRAYATNIYQEVTHSLPANLSVDLPLMPLPLVVAGATWRFLDDGSAPEPGWNSAGFDDSAWGSGPARLGYGGDSEVTKVGFGPNAANKHITTYFRRQFDLDDTSAMQSLQLRLQRDDGAVIYVNGLEVLRSNMPEDAIGPATLAVSAVTGASEHAWFESTLATDWLVPGPNVLAAEVHQANPTSSDLGFDLQLTAMTIPPQTPVLLRWERLPDGQLLLSWPIWMAGQLHSSSAFTASPLSWHRVADPVQTADGVRSVRIDPSGSTRFYQLRTTP